MSDKSKEVFKKLLKQSQYISRSDPTNPWGDNRLITTPPKKPETPMQQMKKFFRKTPDVLSGGKFLRWL